MSDLLGIYVPEAVRPEILAEMPNPTVSLWIIDLKTGAKVYALISDNKRHWPPVYVEGGTLDQAVQELGALLELLNRRDYGGAAAWLNARAPADGGPLHDDKVA